MFECFVAELYDWVTTPAQVDELRELMAKNSEDYRGAILQEFEAYGVIPKQQAAASIPIRPCVVTKVNRAARMVARFKEGCEERSFHTGFSGPSRFPWRHQGTGKLIS